MRSAFALLLIASLLKVSSAWALDAQALPSCAETWSAQAPVRGEGWHRYDYARDQDYPAYRQKIDRGNCAKDWTILIYMAADNDLTPYALWDLYEMEGGYSSQDEVGASTRKTDVVVQLDVAGRSDLRRLHLQQTPEVFDRSLGLEEFQRRTVADVRSPVVERLEEDDQESEAARFEAFVRWGVEKYPARHVMVVVWGHGQGWAPAPRDTPVASRYVSEKEASLGLPEKARFGGVAINARRGSKLDIPAIRGVLARAASDLREGRPFDIYASDACLMQMAEVAAELGPVVDYVVGSAQVQTFIGLPYRRLFYELNSERFGGEAIAAGMPDLSDDELARMEPYLFARMIPRIFKFTLRLGSARNQIAAEAIKTVTMSTLSTAELHGNLIPAMDRLGRALARYIEEDTLRAIDVQFVLQNAPTFAGGAQEIGGFLSLLRLSLANESTQNGILTNRAATLLETLSEAEDALDRTVLTYETGTNYEDAQEQLYLLGFRAFSVWLPVSERDYASRIPDFESSTFYRAAPGWSAGLHSIFH